MVDIKILILNGKCKNNNKDSEVDEIGSQGGRRDNAFGDPF